MMMVLSEVVGGRYKTGRQNRIRGRFHRHGLSRVLIQYDFLNGDLSGEMILAQGYDYSVFMRLSFYIREGFCGWKWDEGTEEKTDSFCSDWEMGICTGRGTCGHS